MSSDQSVFSFDLNESLYFEKGQEVAEVMGISLDPEISIQSFNEYISIRGVVELSGEYQKVVANYVEEEDPLFFDDFHAKRYVETVTDLEDGYAVFAHRFPVEISVPTYRVKDIDDITVRISSFDYEMPDESHLKLISTIEIYGISDYAREPIEEIAESDGEDRVEDALGMEQSFHFEIKKQKDESQDEEHSINIPNTPTLDMPVDNVTEDEKDRWKKTKAQSFAEFFKPESVADPESLSDHVSPDDYDSPADDDDVYDESPSMRESNGPATIIESKESSNLGFVDEGQIEPEREAVQESVEPHRIDVVESVIQESVESRESMVSERMESATNSLPESVEMNESTDHRSEQTADSHYLLGMFRAEEEEYATMRLYIVQEQETLESIAERYQTTSLQLASKNRLTDDNLSRGQVLYIPTKKKKGK